MPASNKRKVKRRPTTTKYEELQARDPAGHERHPWTRAIGKVRKFFADETAEPEERKVLTPMQSELQAIDDALRAEYNRRWRNSEDGAVNMLGDQSILLDWGDDQVAEEPDPSQYLRTNLIRKLREFVGEEPEPAVFPRAAKGFLALVIALVVLPTILLGWLMLTFGFTEGSWILPLVIVPYISIEVIRRILAMRKFGRLKRVLRQKRREVLAKYAADK
jgi:hypothetical protein